MGHFFTSSSLSTFVALFLQYHQKIFIPYIVLVTVHLSLFCNETLFSPSKYIVYKCYSCFRPGIGQFFSSSHLSTFVALFLQYHQKIFIPYIVLVTAGLSLFHNETLFLLQNTLDTNVKFVSDQEWANYFSSSHLSTLVSFFLLLSSKNIYCIYSFGHSSSQSVSQWNSFSPLKYIVYKCFCYFRPGMGNFFFIVTLVYTCRALLLYHPNINPIYCFGHSSSQFVSHWNSFSPLKYIVYKCYSCFRPRMGHFFSSPHLSGFFFCSIIRKY